MRTNSFAGKSSAISIIIGRQLSTISLVLLFALSSSDTVTLAAGNETSPSSFGRFFARLRAKLFSGPEAASKQQQQQQKLSDMGQSATRMIKYDRAANERNAVSALTFGATSSSLQWHRLDDGVMGGQSETKHFVNPKDGVLLFEGTINTNGGGFASIRTPLTAEQSNFLSTNYNGVKIRYKGDGKTYKFILSQAGAGGPMSRLPSWQADLPTTISNGNNANEEEWSEAILPFASLLPNWGGRAGRSTDPVQDKDKYPFDAASMTQMGLMLSLKLSNGRPNPPETFGNPGEIFPFKLQVQSIEPVVVVESSGAAAAATSTCKKGE